MQFLRLDQRQKRTMAKIDKWQYGRRYSVALNGNLLTARERGVKLGDMRIFNRDRLTNESEMFYAEREMKSMFHPFRAPIIWWRRLDEKSLL